MRRRSFTSPSVDLRGHLGLPKCHQPYTLASPRPQVLLRHRHHRQIRSLARPNQLAHSPHQLYKPNQRPGRPFLCPWTISDLRLGRRMSRTSRRSHHRLPNRIPLLSRRVRLSQKPRLIQLLTWLRDPNPASLLLLLRYPVERHLQCHLRPEDAWALFTGKRM